MARALGAPVSRGSCGGCGVALAGGEVFCPALWRSLRGRSACEAHPGVPALSRCVVCARPLCGDCALERDGRAVCGEHLGVAFIEGWAVAEVAETVVEAEGLRRRLAGAGVESRLLVGSCASLLGTLGLYDLTPVIPLLAHASCGGGWCACWVRPDQHGRAADLLAHSAGLRPGRRVGRGQRALPRGPATRASRTSTVCSRPSPNAGPGRCAAASRPRACPGAPSRCGP